MIILFSGQVLPRQNIEDIIKFAKEENLFLMADEVNSM
jgi:alanine transaminase